MLFGMINGIYYFTGFTTSFWLSDIFIIYSRYHVIQIQLSIIKGYTNYFTGFRKYTRSYIILQNCSEVEARLSWCLLQLSTLFTSKFLDIISSSKIPGLWYRTLDSRSHGTKRAILSEQFHHRNTEQKRICNILSFKVLNI